jgi:diadenosine tetraphosphatase ApaH/serine/threonine PP2A family protein phosphatase
MSEDDFYDYTVRYQELDAHGKPCGWQYYEWSGGFERIVDRWEAEAIAQDWRDDPMQHQGEVEVVRRLRQQWEPIESSLRIPHNLIANPFDHRFEE